MVNDIRTLVDEEWDRIVALLPDIKKYPQLITLQKRAFQAGLITGMGLGLKDPATVSQLMLTAYINRSLEKETDNDTN